MFDHELSQQLHDMSIVVVVILTRILPCLILIPAFSIKLMTGLLRVSIACALAAFIFPVVSQEPIVRGLTTMSPLAVSLIFAKEAVLGVCLGALLATPFWVIAAVGELFDSSRGALSGQQLNPELGMDSSVTDDLLRKLAIFLWMEMGGMVWLIGILCNSYRIWKIEDWWPRIGEQAWQTYMTYIQEAFTTLALFAAPLLIVLILVETIIAVMSVHTPRMQAYFLAMPAKSIVGLWMLYEYQRYFQPVIQDWLYRWYHIGWLQS